MILSDADIKKHLENKSIRIDPILDPAVQIQPSSVDLRLGNDFKIFKHTEKPFIDPFDKNSIRSMTELKHVEDKDTFIVHPNDFVLGTTHEYVGIPDDLVARLEGRSSIGRLGIIVHSTAGFIDPGFEGRITLEIGNIGKMPIALYPKMRICQIVFEKLTSRAEVPYGKGRGSKYQGQKMPEESKIGDDNEFARMD